MPLPSVADDPVTDFLSIAGALGGKKPELTPDALEQSISTVRSDDKPAVEARLASYVALNTPLTEGQAQTLVAKACADRTDLPSQLIAVSGAATGAAGLGFDLEFSKPLMLKPWARVVFAACFLLPLGVCIAALWVLGTKNGGTSAIVGLTVVAVFALAAVLVLVMGYSNVVIKAGPPSNSESSGSTGSVGSRLTDGFPV